MLNYLSRITARSGLILSKYFTCFGGMIDSDYEGDIQVALHNLDHNKKVIIEKNEAITQIIFERYMAPKRLFMAIRKIENDIFIKRRSNGFGQCTSEYKNKKEIRLRDD